MFDRSIKTIRTLAEIRMKQSGNILEVNGISMEPLVFEGDKILLEKCSSYHISDILAVVDMNGRILLHRLIRQEDNILITKGDNAVGTDESLIENCLGKAIRIFAQPGEHAELDELYRCKLIRLNRAFGDKIILYLSKRMNRKFISGVPSEELFGGWERRVIKLVVHWGYRWAR